MTNQFTDEQIEAAVNAAWDEAMKHRGIGGQVVQAPTFEFVQVVHAALEAAAGVAPQAESEELAWHKATAKHSADSMAEARDTLQMFADRVDPFVFDELSSVLDDQPLDYETGDVIGKAAPVQPSSTVDEDALAEVIRRSYENEQGLKIRDDKRTARAVAEWLRGESR